MENFCITWPWTVDVTCLCQFCFCRDVHTDPVLFCILNISVYMDLKATVWRSLQLSWGFLGKMIHLRLLPCSIVALLRVIWAELVLNMWQTGALWLFCRLRLSPCCQTDVDWLSRTRTLLTIHTGPGLSDTEMLLTRRDLNFLWVLRCLRGISRGLELIARPSF